MASIQGIYIALFGRPADPGGLAYFNTATKNGADLSRIGDLTQTSEYKSRFTGMSNEEIVNSIYKSLFNRDGEKTGIDFFLAKLASGALTINTIAIAILDGAQGDDLVTVKAKIDAADIFTSHLDLQAEIEAYKGNAAAQIGRDFITAVSKTDPGTAEEADAAILKVQQSQGQAPAGGGGDGGGGGPPTFEIINNAIVETAGKTSAPDGITFGGTAKGTIILGQSSDTQAQTPGLEKTELAPVEFTPLLTGARGSTVASFPKGDIQSGNGVKLAELPDNLMLKDKLYVSMTAGTASGHQIGGDGAVEISGSAGDQTIHVSTTGRNVIEGGRGADTIDISGSTGRDMIRINGLSDESKAAIEAFAKASAPVDERNALKDAVTTAEKAAQDFKDGDLAKAQQSLADAKANLDAANAALATAQSDYDKAVKFSAVYANDFAFGVKSQFDGTVKSVQSAIDFVSGYLPSGLKNILINDLPKSDKEFGPTLTIDDLVAKLVKDINDYPATARDAVGKAQITADQAPEAVKSAQSLEEKYAKFYDDLSWTVKTKQGELDDAREIVSDEKLELKKTDAATVLKNVGTQTDSLIHHEDKITGFEIGKDHLSLSSYKIMDAIADGSFNVNGQEYGIDVKAGIGHVIDYKSKMPVKLSGDLLKETLNYLANDAIVKDGQTVAFDYADGEESGLYIFHGGDYGSDTGIKLVGLGTLDKSLTLTSIFNDLP